DAELRPWGSRGGQGVRDRYAAAGAAAASAGPAAVSALELAVQRLAGTAASDEAQDLAELLARTRSRVANADRFAAAYQRYCWPIEGLNGVRLAPFALLGSEGAAPAGRPHRWHLALPSPLARARARAAPA